MKLVLKIKILPTDEQRMLLFQTMEEANKAVVSYINDVCKNILYNTAVFKKDEVGQAAFLRFLSKVEESL